MKKLSLMALTITMGILLIGCNDGEATSSKFKVPLSSNIQYINISSDNKTIKCTDKDTINKLMDEINNSKLTDNESVQDVPSTKNYYKIDILDKNNDNIKSVYMYKKNTKWLIEAPYEFISNGSDNIAHLINDIERG